METINQLEMARQVLPRYGFGADIVEEKVYLRSKQEDGWLKLIFAATLRDGKKLVLKFLREDKEELSAEMEKIERQSRFSEFLREQGIASPARHQTEGRYCSQFVCGGQPCAVTVEDWCGEEIREISTDTAYRIGALMARMHRLSLDSQYRIGRGTLFSAAYWNDVDVFSDFCRLAAEERLEQSLVAQIKALREEKLTHIREVWETLPKAAVQGDISINNLVQTEHGLIVFDYNNAGDEVLVSDLVLEGLLTAYEMDLPEGAPESLREEIFPALLRGYLSLRPLSPPERRVAWEIYTLYHGLWFSRILYNQNSLDALLKRGDHHGANCLLKRMLRDLQEQDDGRFGEVMP